jgi:hypothetical protein
VLLLQPAEEVGIGGVSCSQGGGGGETEARQSGGGCGPNAVGTGGHRCSDRVADEWA